MKIKTGRVKSIAQHPSSPISLVSCHTGDIHFIHRNSFFVYHTIRQNMPVRTVAFSDDGSYFAFGCDDHKIYIYDFKKMSSYQTVSKHRDYIRKSIFYRNLVISCSDDQQIISYDYLRREVVERLSGHTNYIMDLKMAGEHIISASLDNTLRIWKACALFNISIPQCDSVEGHLKGINCVYAHKNMIVSGGDDNAVRIFKFENSSLIEMASYTRHKKPVTAIVMTDEYILSGSEDGTLIKYKSGQVQVLLDLGERIWSVEYTDGDIFVGSDSGSTVIKSGQREIYAQSGEYFYFLSDDSKINCLKNMVMSFSVKTRRSSKNILAEKNYLLVNYSKSSILYEEGEKICAFDGQSVFYYKNTDSYVLNTEKREGLKVSNMNIKENNYANYAHNNYLLCPNFILNCNTGEQNSFSWNRKNLVKFYAHENYAYLIYTHGVKIYKNFKLKSEYKISQYVFSLEYEDGVIVSSSSRHYYFYEDRMILLQSNINGSGGIISADEKLILFKNGNFKKIKFLKNEIAIRKSGQFTDSPQSNILINEILNRKLSVNLDTVKLNKKQTLKYLVQQEKYEEALEQFIDEKSVDEFLAKNYSLNIKNPILSEIFTSTTDLKLQETVLRIFGDQSNSLKFYRNNNLSEKINIEIFSEEKILSQIAKLQQNKLICEKYFSSKYS